MVSHVCMYVYMSRTIQESDHAKFEVDGIPIRNSLCVPLRADSGQVFAVLQVCVLCVYIYIYIYAYVHSMYIHETYLCALHEYVHRYIPIRNS